MLENGYEESSELVAAGTKTCVSCDLFGAKAPVVSLWCLRNWQVVRVGRVDCSGEYRNSEAMATLEEDGLDFCAR